MMKLCYRYGLPVVPFGGGTSLEGQTLSPRTGVSIDFKNMKGSLDLNVKVNTLDFVLFYLIISAMTCDVSAL